MGLQGSVIETGVDKLVNLVKQRGKIALADAAVELGLSTSIIQEWVNFLEDEGIISVEYRLTKPFLVERKLTKKEVDDKAKDFSSKKDIFVRKAEVSLSFLQQQERELKKIKDEFDKMKSELGIELDAVRDELKDLERFQQLKQEMQRQIEEQKNDSKMKTGELIRQIITEQKKYQELVSDVKKERQELDREKSEAMSIEESEKMLNKKLVDLKNMISLIEKRVYEEDTTIKNSESHIERLKSLIDEIRIRAENEKSAIEPLIEKSREQERKMLFLQDEIIKRVSQSKKDISNAKDATIKVNNFLNKKLEMINLVDKVNNDRDVLEKSLLELIKKAKAFQLTSKGGDVGKDMAELEKKFVDLDKKKTIFEGELKKLTSFFKVS